MTQPQGTVYAKQTLDAPNPLARYAHATRYNLALQLVEKNLKNGGSLLDYGCSTGFFLTEMHRRRPDAVLFGTDIRPLPPTDAFTFVGHIKDVPDASLDMVCSFEVLEHLFDEERFAFYDEVKRILKPGGMCIVSVPIIAGPMLLVKQLNKIMFYGQPDHSKYTPGELIRAAFFGIPAPRPEGIRETHKGFDFRQVEKAMEERFQVAWKRYSPFEQLPWMLNSQFFIAVTVPSV